MGLGGNLMWTPLAYEIYKKTGKISVFISNKKIVEDKINILIDLSGYSSQNRLSIFLAKPAPVQVTGFGFLQTTGLKEIDYILADKNIVTDTKNFTEEVLVDQETWSTLDLNNIEIKVEELPAKKNRYITFGAFNNFNKLNEETFNFINSLKLLLGKKIRIKANYNE